MLAVAIVFLSATALALAVIAAVVFGRFRATCEFAVGGGAFDITVAFYWIHQWIVSGHVNTARQSGSLKVLFWQLGQRAVSESAHTPSPDPVAHPLPSQTQHAEPPPAPAPESALPVTTRVVFDSAQAPRGRESTPARRELVRYLLRRSQWRRAMVRCLGAAVRGLRWPAVLRCAHVHVHAGGGDPAALGKTTGIVHAIHAAMNSAHPGRFSLHLTPDFERSRFDMQGTFTLDSSLARFLSPFFAALLRFPYYQTVRGWIDFRRGQRTVDAQTRASATPT